MAGPRSWLFSPMLRAAVMLLVGGAVFAFVLQATVAAVLKDAKPAIVLSLAPNDAEALVSQATAILADRGLAGGAEAQRLALASLRRSPLNAEAFRTLGFVAVANGDTALALRLVSMAERLSRRDLLAQIWLIEYYSRTNDIEGTLSHYRTALRSSERSWPLLAPILARASAEPVIARSIGRLLANRQEPWWDAVVSELVAHGPNFSTLVPLLQDRLDASDPTQRSYVETLLNRMLEAQQFDLAHRAYRNALRVANSSPSPAIVRNGGFEQASIFPPFDWQLAAEADLGAERAPRAEGGNGLDLYAFNGRSGEVARQLIHIPTGPARIALDVGGVLEDGADRPTLAIRCATGDGAYFTTLQLEPGAARRVFADFVVPPACPWQWLLIRAGGRGPPSDRRPYIDNVAIETAARGNAQDARYRPSEAR